MKSFHFVDLVELNSPQNPSKLERYQAESSILYRLKKQEEIKRLQTKGVENPSN